MSMERRFEQVRAQVASPPVERRRRTAAALGMALVVGAVSVIALCQWRRNHEPAEPGQQISYPADNVASQANRLALLELSPLVSDRWADRVGTQEKLLQPVQGAIVLEPALGVDAAARTVLSETDAPGPTEWLASILKPDGARRFSESLAAVTPTAASARPAPPEPVLPVDQAAHRSWDRAEPGP